MCATYVSPHVNVAARLESATKQYGVDLLLSSTVVDRLPSDWRVHCRLLDRVQLLGNSTPTPLFTPAPRPVILGDAVLPLTSRFQTTQAETTVSTER